jgi:hypothetical protein
MKKLIRHKWNKITGSGLLKHFICERCNCQKWHDWGFGKVIFTDRFLNQYIFNPGCELPNIKL